MTTNHENERLDRIEQHLKLLKNSDEEKTLLLLSIKASLVGSDMNGNKGIIQSVEDIDDRVKELEKQGSEIQLYLKQSKWIVAAIITALIGIVAEIIKR